MRRLSIIFLAAFALNAIWENLHSLLYANYMQGQITELILLRASLADAVMITIMAFPFLFFLAKKHEWIIVPVGFIVAICIEFWALKTGRWAYNAYMPIIPLLAIGLTPAIQLGLLGYASLKIEKFRCVNRAICVWRNSKEKGTMHI